MTPVEQAVRDLRLFADRLESGMFQLHTVSVQVQNRIPQLSITVTVINPPLIPELVTP